jgi:hypothetical protein
MLGLSGKPLNPLGIETGHALAQIVNATILALMSQHETFRMT